MPELDQPAERYAAERHRRGIGLGDDIEGGDLTLALLLDPDGNLITQATPRARPCSAP